MIFDKRNGRARPAGALLLSGALLLTACGGGGSEETTDAAATGAAGAEQILGPVTLGTLPSGSFVIAYVADQLGYFEEAGIDVDVKEVGGGLAAVLATDELDYGLFAGSAIYQPRFAGSDTVMVASLVDGALMRLMGAEGVDSIDDLRGQRVAYSVEDSVATLYFKEVLKQHGIDPEEDVQGQVIASPPDQFTALVSGQVAGAVVSPPSNIIAEAEGATELFDLDDLENFPFPRAALLTTEEFAAEHDEETVRVIEGLIRAIEGWDERPDEIMAIMADLQGTEVDELIEEAYRVVGEALTAEPVIEEAESANVLDALVEMGLTEEGEHEPSDFYTNEYVERALER